MANGTDRRRFISRAVAVAALTAAASLMLMTSTAAQNQGARAAAAGRSDTDQRPYNKRDFNGLWSHNPGEYGLPACPECAEQFPIRVPGYGYFGDVPPRTAEGERKLQMTRHGRGFEADSEEAKKYPTLDPAYKRAGLPAFSNDPEARCEMMGLARSIVMAGPNSNMEMVHTQANDRIIHRFEWFADHRNIWMDGRQLPDAGDYLPGVNGYSIGKWEGDTLVVTSTGFDDRQWVDMYGFPISENAVLVERWERPSPNRLRVQLTLTDPVNYTRPWTSTVKTWALIPKEKMSVGGWSGIFEDRCIPSDEALFNEFRDHAAGVKQP
jgi:hypothetical protein